MAVSVTVSLTPANFWQQSGNERGGPMASKPKRAKVALATPNTVNAARHREIVDAIKLDLGVSKLSASDAITVANVAALLLLCEGLKARLIEGERIDADVMNKTANSAKRLTENLRRNIALRSPGAGFELGAA